MIAKRIVYLGMALFLLVAPMNGKANACPLPLLEKEAEGKLSGFQQEVLDKWRMNFNSVQQQYERELSAYRDAEVSGTVTEALKSRLFFSGVSLIQFGLEYFGYLNEGPYPDNVYELVNADLIASMPFDPYANGEMKVVLPGATASANSGVIYVPEYEKWKDEVLVAGYWLIVMTPDGGEAGIPSPHNPLPGGIIMPANTHSILESHMDED